VRKGNHGSLPANAGTSGVLPRMLPTAAGHGRGLTQALLFSGNRSRTNVLQFFLTPSYRNDRAPQIEALFLFSPLQSIFSCEFLIAHSFALRKRWLLLSKAAHRAKRCLRSAREVLSGAYRSLTAARSSSFGRRSDDLWKG
jgi:hypothetical protein